MRPLVLAALLAGVLPASAQAVPPKRSPDTFDVAAWNVEWFGSTSNGPSDEARQQAHVLQAIREADLDVWFFEEVSSQTALNRLRVTLEPEGGPAVATVVSASTKPGCRSRPAGGGPPPARGAA